MTKPNGSKAKQNASDPPPKEHVETMRMLEELDRHVSETLDEKLAALARCVRPEEPHPG